MLYSYGCIVKGCISRHQISNMPNLCGVNKTDTLQPSGSNRSLVSINVYLFKIVEIVGTEFWTVYYSRSVSITFNN